LRDLLTDSTRREMCAIEGIDRARSRHSWDRIAQEAAAPPRKRPDAISGTA
jgi:hypothetical protein